MPLLKGKEWVLAPRPRDLEPFEPVYVCRITDEVFRDYNEYSDRIMLYISRIWACRITNKGSMTYEEAQAHEDKELASLLKPLNRDFAREIFLTAQQHSKVSLETLAKSMVHTLTSNRCFIDETVTVKSADGSERQAVVVSVVVDPNAPEFFSADPVALSAGATKAPSSTDANGAVLTPAADENQKEVSAAPTNNMEIDGVEEVTDSKERIPVIGRAASHYTVRLDSGDVVEVAASSCSPQSRQQTKVWCSYFLKQSLIRNSARQLEVREFFIKELALPRVKSMVPVTPAIAEVRTRQERQELGKVANRVLSASSWDKPAKFSARVKDTRQRSVLEMFGGVTGAAGAAVAAPKSRFLIKPQDSALLARYEKEKAEREQAKHLAVLAERENKKIREDELLNNPSTLGSLHLLSFPMSVDDVLHCISIVEFAHAFGLFILPEELQTPLGICNMLSAANPGGEKEDFNVTSLALVMLQTLLKSSENLLDGVTSLPLSLLSVDHSSLSAMLRLYLLGTKLAPEATAELQRTPFCMLSLRSKLTVFDALITELLNTDDILGKIDDSTEKTHDERKKHRDYIADYRKGDRDRILKAQVTVKKELEILAAKKAKGSGSSTPTASTPTPSGPAPVALSIGVSAAEKEAKMSAALKAAAPSERTLEKRHQDDIRMRASIWTASACARTQPIGVDRHFRSYWRFHCIPGVFVETPSVTTGDKAHSLSRCLDLPVFLTTLDRRGVRERVLREALENELLVQEFEKSRTGKNHRSFVLSDERMLELDAAADLAGTAPVFTEARCIDVVVRGYIHELLDLEERLTAASLGGVNKEMRDQWRATVAAVAEENKDSLSSLLTTEQTTKPLIDIIESIPQHFLKEPLGTSTNKQYANILQRQAEATQPGQSAFVVVESFSAPTETEAPETSVALRALVTKVRSAQSVHELVHCLAVLDSFVLWDKSIANIRCRSCRRKGDESKLILCANCESGFHYNCLTPALTEKPAGDWLCLSCAPRSKKAVRRSAEDDGAGGDENERDEPALQKPDNIEHLDACLKCKKGGELLLCDYCENVYHLDCLEMRVVPKGDWACPTCVEKQQDVHADECSHCKEGGKLICCDECDRSFHQKCVGLKSVPKGAWSCPHCKPKSTPATSSKKKTKKVAEQFVTRGAARKPVSYKEVDEDEDEDDDDDEASVHSSDVDEDEDNEGDTDDNDDLCFICETGDGDDELVCCDYCPKSLHLECADLRTVPRGKFRCGYCNLVKGQKANNGKKTAAPAHKANSKKQKQKKRSAPASSRRSKRRKAVDSDDEDEDDEQDDEEGEDDDEQDEDADEPSSGKLNGEVFGYGSEDDDDEKKEDTNDDKCTKCKKTGKLLCCETCPKAYHLSCVGLKKIPKGDWYCSDCAKKSK